MALPIGTQLGSHEITALLGKGGMGEVYRARDLKLKREVAIKILPEEFSRDADRVTRFQREAEVLASLNHPNIAAIYDLEEANGSRFLVLELVEGETLADRITRGPIPVEEAISIALRICEALEAAHEKGIVHRDLKPANIKVLPDGKVKVLDFGLAKALAKDAPGVSMSQSPTLSLSATNAGALIGTAAYIPPEQVKGFTSDQRGDIFAFGCVLYEVLTGKQTFEGDTIPEILASVLKSEPKLDLLPQNLPPRMRELLRRCLEKNPKRRWYAIGDVRVELEAIAAAPAVVPESLPADSPTAAWTWRIVALVAGLIAGAGLTAFMTMRSQPTARPAITRFVYPLPEGQSIPSGGTHLAISRDGTQIAYQTSSGLYVRSMEDFQPRAIPGGDVNGEYPTFSPDGKFIAFYSGTEKALKKVALAGGPSQTLCPASAPNGSMDWSDTGILFAQGTRILRVPSNGGQPEVVVSTKPTESITNIGVPQLLPGGDAVVFAVQTQGVTDGDKLQTVVQTLKSGQRHVLIPAGSDARYVPTGHLVYVFGGTLVAVPFDVKRLEVTGGAVPILEGVRKPGLTAEFGFSNSGTLIYVPDPVRLAPQGGVTLALLDRDGKKLEPLKMRAGNYDAPRISPNGKQAAYVSDDGKETDIWIYDLSGASSPHKLTFGGANRYPVWSGDSQLVAFQSDREGDFGIWQQRADGDGPAERLTKADKGVAHMPDSWSLDSQWLSFTSIKDSGQDIWVYSTREKKASPFTQVPMEDAGRSAFSPDGKWLAYQRRSKGTFAVIVQPFPANGSQYEISDCVSSLDPLWSHDGKELFCQPRGGIVSVSVNTRPTFTFGNAKTLAGGPGFLRPGPGSPRAWDIMPDGKRFIVVARGSQTEANAVNQINVVLNWFRELQELVPVK